MEFNAINIFGLGIMIIMMIPNIFFAMRFRDAENKCKGKLMNIIEQIGRYASFLLMFFPLDVWKFGFQRIETFLAYAFANAGLLLAYLIIWIFYFKKQSIQKALALAIIPTCIFLISGITLQHWLLVASAIVFGIGHTYVTYQNNIRRN